MNKGIEFMHIRAYESDFSMSPSSRGGKTVAIMPMEGNRVKFSVARCGPNDTFNKKVGRDIAEGRLTAYLKGRGSLADKVFELQLEDEYGDAGSLRAQVKAKIDSMKEFA